MALLRYSVKCYYRDALVLHNAQLTLENVRKCTLVPIVVRIVIGVCVSVPRH